MATKKRKPAASRKRKPRAGKELIIAVRKVKEPKSGTLRSALDPKWASLPEKEPANDNPDAQPQLTGALSGDLQGLDREEDEAYESVAELADEGQDLEAEEIEAIENAPDPDTGPLKPRKVADSEELNDFKDRNRL